MTAEVVSINGAPLENERRAAFLQAVAASFDGYVQKHGEEPDGIVYALCGVRQTSSLGWDIRGDSAGAATSVLSLAAIHMTAEASAPYRPTE